MLEEVKRFLKDNSYLLDNGCIQWKVLNYAGRTNINGYNLAKEVGINYAHRLAYMVYKDNDIQYKPEIRLFHSCKNKGCINVNHLYEHINKNSVVTPADKSSYNYYNNGKYTFYLKFTKTKIKLDPNKYIVEKGKVFRISYIEPFDEILKEECTNIGVLCKGEELC